MSGSPLVVRAAAVLAWISAAGLGASCLAAIWSLAMRGKIAFIFGYPTFGQGPFERHGVPTTIRSLSLS